MISIHVFESRFKPKKTTAKEDVDRRHMYLDDDDVRGFIFK